MGVNVKHASTYAAKIIADHSEFLRKWTIENASYGVSFDDLVGVCSGLGASTGVFIKVMAIRYGADKKRIRDIIVSAIDISVEREER